MTTNQAMTTAAKMASEARKAIMDNNFYLSPVIDSVRAPSEQKSRQQEMQTTPVRPI